MSTENTSTSKLKSSFWSENSWIANLYKEQSELIDRLGRLDLFLNNTEIKDLDHKALLEKQQKVMRQYIDVLQKRINLIHKRYSEDNKTEKK